MEPRGDTPSPSSIPAAARVPLDDERDRQRRPRELIAFLNVRPGMTVVELGAGDGYTSIQLAAALGGNGRVVAQNPPEWRGFLAPYLAARLRNGPIDGVQWADLPFEDPVPLTLEPGTVDLVVNVLTYHDLPYMNVDRAAMNRTILRALKPGAAYVVVDHSARREDRDRVSATLHRIAEDLVVEEVRRAGFDLAATADFLRHPSDDRTTLAWTRPQPITDRFALRFVKP